MVVDASLTLNLAKCVFGQTRVTYLGKVVGCGKVCPIRAKVEAISCTHLSPGYEAISYNGSLL